MSAIIAGLLPKIEGFQPIPNAVMIPFMEAQSAALAYGFGLNYEFGKRKIRSMSNDEFNSLTSEDVANISNLHTHVILSKFQEAVPRVMPMQAEIFNQYVIIEKLKVKQNFELFQWIIQFVATSGSQVLIDALAGFLGGRSTDAENQPTGYEVWLQSCKKGDRFLKDDGTTVDCPASSYNDTTPPPPPGYTPPPEKDKEIIPDPIPETPTELPSSSTTLQRYMAISRQLLNVQAQTANNIAHTVPGASASAAKQVKGWQAHFKLVKKLLERYISLARNYQQLKVQANKDRKAALWQYVKLPIAGSAR